ncbi:aminotransferase class I/II-fold pyridoxal phosphate-dependent enzyme [Streptomyces meridianus]|uniref:Aminotransferase class I/II-fold pyridoxal phosphate-dependent enzyme n=1 Tax=Streptomyces meridianus TaxID=2938945 RepID=A0ABT0XCN9_9ACTN|nr:aminotransferase class I/II-fold pyridoxal phosphate-dependent enzyme [Streptomyces meridianus]MCM2580199.1 aminotransferase class I/II-fold pyridoxal phosphate-dependent enzyme [Streptomyces meridianus]
MERTRPDSRGPAPFGPPVTDAGLPVLPELAGRAAAAAGDVRAQPAGGGAEVLEAACGYWRRRSLPTGVDRAAAAPGAQPLLLALLAAIGGEVLLTRPCAPWYPSQARLLGLPAYHAPAPAECGGVPDPFAFLETVRRVRAEGGDPRVLLTAVVDDPTGTFAPPELMHEVCEAAVDEGLLIISDETYRETLHREWPGREGVPVGLLSPAEMQPDHVVVLADLGADLVPAAWPAAIARFPDTPRGAQLHAATLDALSTLHAVLPSPVAAAVAHALTEPQAVTERRSEAARLHGAIAAALYSAVTAAGAFCRPPRAGGHLYPDLEPLRPALDARGITDSVDLEDRLSADLGVPVPGGHRFGDAPDLLRVRLSTGPLLGADDDQGLEVLVADDPLTVPHVAGFLERFAAWFDDLAGG